MLVAPPPKSFKVWSLAERIHTLGKSRKNFGILKDFLCFFRHPTPPKFNNSSPLKHGGLEDVTFALPFLLGETVTFQGKIPRVRKFGVIFGVVFVDSFIGPEKYHGSKKNTYQLGHP